MNEEYFNKFPERMKQKFNTLEDDLANNAPLLSELDKSEPYLIPDQYFENNQLALSGLAKRKLGISKTRFIRKRLFAAASLIALMVTSWAVFNNPTNTEEVQIAYEDIADHYLDNLEDIDLDLIYSMEEEEVDIDLDLEDLNEEEIDLYWDYLFQDITDLELINTL